MIYMKALCSYFYSKHCRRTNDTCLSIKKRERYEK